MKILLIQENGRHQENRRFRECFSMQSALVAEGCEVDIIGLGHENQNADFDAYDVIFNLENYDPGWVPNFSKTKAKKVFWDIDSHVKGRGSVEKNNDRQRYDLILHSSRDSIMEDCSVWFPNCYDDTLIRPLNVDKKHLFGFCGNLVNRKPFFDGIREVFPEFNLDIFVIGDKMVEAVNSYTCHINKNVSYDINYRTFETIGCGTLLITNYNPNLSDLGFRHGKNCLIYNTFENCLDIMEKCKAGYYDLAEISRKGHVLAAKHTYRERAKTFLWMIENIV